MLLRSIITLSVIGLGSLFYGAMISAANASVAPSRSYEQLSSKPDWDLSKVQTKPDWDLYVAHKIDKQQLKCLAKNIYHEARGSSYKDQMAVAMVTINRSKHKDWPDDLCDVVYQHAQFSWTLDKRLWKINDNKSYKRAEKIAFKVLTKQYKDITKGSTHYYNPKYADPNWADEGINKVKIGEHVYMKMSSGSW